MGVHLMCLTTPSSRCLDQPSRRTAVGSTNCKTVTGIKLLFRTSTFEEYMLLISGLEDGNEHRKYKVTPLGELQLCLNRPDSDYLHRSVIMYSSNCILDQGVNSLTLRIP